MPDAALEVALLVKNVGSLARLSKELEQSLADPKQGEALLDCAKAIVVASLKIKANPALPRDEMIDCISLFIKTLLHYK